MNVNYEKIDVEKELGKIRVCEHLQTCNLSPYAVKVL